MKKKLLLTLLTTFSLGLGILSSCSSSFFGDNSNALEIDSITSNVDSGTGDTLVTITYKNEDTDPLVLKIPAGLAGKDGVSISSITPVVNSDNSVTLTIAYSDSSVASTVLTIPVTNGKDGVSITGVDVSVDDNKNTIISFTYSNGTKSDNITIPHGTDGIGIESITSTLSEDESKITIKITTTDGEETSFDVDNGKRGIGIYSVEYNEEETTDDNYVLDIVYTDGSYTSVSLPRPQSTLWLYGTTDPSSTLGKNGDFYINISSGEVFIKENDNWNAKFSIKGSGSSTEVVRYNVIFDPNGGTFASGSATSIRVERGTCLELDDFPVVTKENYEFVGWYTSLNDINSGKFTDLTPVVKNVTLYAKWESPSIV